MITQDDIFGITDDAAFEAAALEVFRRQAAECPPYREYLALAGVRPEEVRAAREIPFLPIEIFKTHDVYCGGTEPEAVFTSSATTGMTPSRHPMRSLALYERTFRAAFRTFYGEPGQWSLYALLPNYLRRKGSSLVYMADRLIADCGSGGFYLDDYDALLTAMQADPKPKILLGVSYALWDLAERYAPKLENTVIMETGGMKGYREEIPKEEFHKILCGAFGVGAIHSEYGMAELTSRHDPRRERSVRSAARGNARRAEHRRSGELVVVRVHPDAGRGPGRCPRSVRRRGAHRPQRHQRMQLTGTVNLNGFPPQGGQAPI